MFQELQTYIHTYHSRFIPVGVAEVSQIFLWDTHVLPKLYLIARSTIASVKQRLQRSIIGWVTINLLSPAPRCFVRHVKPLAQAAFVVVNSHQAVMGAMSINLTNKSIWLVSYHVNKYYIWRRPIWRSGVNTRLLRKRSLVRFPHSANIWVHEHVCLYWVWVFLCIICMYLRKRNVYKYVFTVINNTSLISV
jgi:hypothetical protein